MSRVARIAEQSATTRGSLSARSSPVSATPPAFSRSDRARAALLGLHGLALMVVFPLGPQAARLWQPGVPGIAALVAAFPFAVVLGGLLARRAPSLPARPGTLAVLAFATTLPCALSFDYPSLFLARIVAGLASGVSYAAVFRALPLSTHPLVGRLAPRIIAFGLPACLLAATALDWRFAFAPILLGQAFLVAFHKRDSRPSPAVHTSLHEAAPLALVATGALAFVSAACLTVLSGCLVFNAGHTEWHIPLVLLLAALLGLAVPPALDRLRVRLAPAAVYAAALAASALSLAGLLPLRGPTPAVLAVAAIAAFLVANAARHLSLARLVLPRLSPADLAAHQTHAHLAHHLGSGLGALAAGALVFATPARTLAGLPVLLGASLAATDLALLAGLAAARRFDQPSASPAARAASAKSRLRVAASFVRSVRASITRSPGSETLAPSAARSSAGEDTM